MEDHWKTFTLVKESLRFYGQGTQSSFKGRDNDLYPEV